MLRSMYSGISGMKNFQTKLDVVGNNIANVNTAGFKKGRITFQDLMSQTSSPAQGATGNRGGVNAIQVGTGAQIGSIDNVHTQGFKQNTERPLDLMLEGDGFFVVDLDGQNAYTRAGNFSLDEDGNLVNTNGYHVMGSTIFNDNGEIKGDEVSPQKGDDEQKPTPDPFNDSNDLDKIRIPETIKVKGEDEPKSVKSFSILKDGTVQVVAEDVDTPIVVGEIAVSQFSNDGGLEKAGENLWLASAASGGPLISGADENGAAEIQTGALEMSNVDLSEEFTEMITAQRGFQANTRIITTSDEILQELVNLKR